MPADKDDLDELQPPGVPAARVVLISVACLALIAVVLAGSASFFWGETGKGRVPEPATFPAPRILQNQGVERRQLYADQRQRLASYRWIDEPNQIIAIPIERAMQLIAGSGSNGYAPIGQKAPAPQAQAAATPAPAQPKTAAQAAAQKQAAQKPAPSRGRPRGVRQGGRSHPHPTPRKRRPRG